MNFISDILFWISTGLLVPTIVLLILFFLRALMLVGSFFGAYLSHRRSEKQLRNALDALSPEALPTLAEALPKAEPEAARHYAALLAALGSEAKADRVIAQFESASENALSLPRTLAKVGPILGLMGTLIPMGPALVGLSTGDIASMAYNMQVAFATTVVGLVIGAIGSLVLQVRKRWAAEHLANLEFIAALAAENASAQ